MNRLTLGGVYSTRLTPVTKRGIRFGLENPPPVKKPEAPKTKPEPGFFERRWNAATEFLDSLLMRDAQSVMAKYIAQNLQKQLSGDEPMTWQVDNYNFKKGQKIAYSFVNSDLPPRLRDPILEKLGVLHRDAEGKPTYSPLTVTLFKSHQGVTTMEVGNRLVGIHEKGSLFPFGPSANTRWIFNQLQTLDQAGTLPQSTKAKNSIADEASRNAYQAARTSLIELLADKATMAKKETITGDNVRYAGHTRITLSPVTLPESVAKELYLPVGEPVSLELIHGGNNWLLQYRDRALFSPTGGHLDPKWEWWNRNVKGYKAADLAFARLVPKLQA